MSPEQIARLDEVLTRHDYDVSRLPYEVPPMLAYACLVCGSIGESDPEQRDHLVKNFDMRCCVPGVTVIFHSTHKVLVDPRALVLVAAEPDSPEDAGFDGRYDTP